MEAICQDLSTIGDNMKKIKYSVDNGICKIQLNRPEVMNALDLGLMREFRNIIRYFDAEEDVKVILTCGNEKAFSAGSDLLEIGKMTPDEAEEAELVHVNIAEELARCHKPTVAYIQGYAIGGGMTLALYHDIRYCDNTAKFSMPEIKLGWFPAWGVEKMRRELGNSVTRYLLYTCKMVDSAEALRHNIVHDIVTDEKELLKKIEVLKINSDVIDYTKPVINNTLSNEHTAEIFKYGYKSKRSEESLHAFILKNYGKEEADKVLEARKNND